MKVDIVEESGRPRSEPRDRGPPLYSCASFWQRVREKTEKGKTRWAGRAQCISIGVFCPPPRNRCQTRTRRCRRIYQKYTTKSTPSPRRTACPTQMMRMVKTTKTSQLLRQLYSQSLPSPRTRARDATRRIVTFVAPSSVARRPSATLAHTMCRGSCGRAAGSTP
jgi:hypothetical protein